MLSTERHDDVTRLVMRSWRTRTAGYAVSAYLVRGVLVDTGFGGTAPQLDGWLRDARRRQLHGGHGEGLACAVVTHAHEDHSGNAGLLQERGVPVWIAPATRAAFAAMQPVPLYRRFVWSAPLPLLPDAGRLATDRVALPDGIEVLHAPGHSDDHHVVWDQETGTLFGGDLFLGVKVRIAHHGERPRLLVRTLRRFAALDPARLFDAHRGPVPTPAAALTAKADWLDETIATIERLHATGMSVRTITRQVLGREPNEYYVSVNEYSKRQLVECVIREVGSRESGVGST